MAKKRQPPAVPKKQPLAHYLRPACLSCAAALAVAAPLVPSERTELTGAALPQTMLWLLLALVWFAGAWLTRHPLRRFDLVDFAAIAFAVWLAVSGVVMLRYGSPRLTINALWTWASMICAFLLLRQLLRGEREFRALCAVMIGAAVCLSVVAIHQTFIAYPQMRELYHRDPDEALRRAEVHAPPGSVQRKQFEDRLHSTEPTATFSLTNSLAGFVAPWLVLLVAVASSRREILSRATWARWSVVIAPWLIASPLVICLLLTKSRSAWLATIFGVICLAITRWTIAGGQRPAPSQRLAVLAVVVVVTTASAALAAIGVFDINIVAQAGRSLAFRLEYWSATLAMIADHPLLGVGPGNFQEYYTAYKLPQASETIADPHNFAFEIAATAGIAALLAFIAIVALAMKTAFAGPAHAKHQDEKPNEIVSHCVRATYGGACAAIPLAAMLGLAMGYMPDMLPLLLGAVVGAFAVRGLHGWVEHGALPRWAIAVAIGVLLVNLLAAGGISFPGVAITLWMLLAGGQRPATSADFRAGRWPPAIGAMVAAVMLLACYATAYQPVLTRMRWIHAAEDAQQQARFGEAIDFAEQAAAADHWSAEPHLQLAQLHFERWIASTQPRVRDADFQAFQVHAAAALARNRRAYPAIVAISYSTWEGYRATGNPPLCDDALRLAARSVELYPHDALGRAQLAWLLDQAGKTNEAQREASEALRLDGLCPHSERKLAERRLFGEVASQQQIARMPDDLRNQNAEQWMHRLRNNGR